MIGFAGLPGIAVASGSLNDLCERFTHGVESPP
jgi:hypothetical protein